MWKLFTVKASYCPFWGKKALKLWFSTAFTSLFLGGCVVGFRNPNAPTRSQPMKVFLPSAIDNSPTGGGSGPLTTQLRLGIARTRLLQLATNREEADVLVDVRILNRVAVVTKIADCTGQAGTLAAEIGGGAYACQKVQNSLVKPPATAEEGALYTFALVHILEARRLKPVTTLVFDQKNGTAITMPFDYIGPPEDKTGLAKKPQLHGFRYLENQEKAVVRTGDTLAQHIVAALSNTTLPEDL